MSYMAYGGGQVVMKKEVPDNVLALLDNRGAGFLVEDAPDGGLWFTFEFGSYNDQIDNGFKALAPYVEFGNVEFTGEDSEHWRFHFENGEVEEQSGEITYKSNKQKTRTFNVNYLDPQNEEDQTQFDVEDADFVTMFNELVGLFGEFAGENYGDDPCWILDIEEVPYDGEEE